MTSSRTGAANFGPGDLTPYVLSAFGHSWTEFVGGPTNDTVAQASPRSYAGGLGILQTNASGSSSQTITGPDNGYRPRATPFAFSGDFVSSGAMYDFFNIEQAYSDGIIYSDEYTDRYADDGVTLAYDEWYLKDIKGFTVYNPDGSGSGQFASYDRSRSGTITVGANGSIVIDNFSQQGVKSSEDWWHADGSHGVTTFAGDGSSSVVTYQANGKALISKRSATGGLVNEKEQAAGSVLSPDGSSFSKVVNADGTYSVNYADADGQLLVYQYGASGRLTRTYGLSEMSADPYRFQGSTNGSTWFSPLNQYTRLYGDGTIEYYNNSNQLTGADWTNPDGSQVVASFLSDGSKKILTYQTDGSHTEATDDGKGNKAIDYYSPAGMLFEKRWSQPDGALGDLKVNADGSQAGIIKYPDGSYTLVTIDAEGNSRSQPYDALGNPKAPGGSGNNGTSTSYNSDGSYITTADDGHGNITKYYYDPAGHLLQKNWSTAGGASGNEVYNADGSSVATIVGTQGNDVLNGGAGNDSFLLLNGVDNGLDQYDGGSGVNVIVGSYNSDVLRVSSGLANLKNIQVLDGGPPASE